MATSNPTDILLQHNLWANRQLIEASAKLTPEQFHQRFDMGPGSVHDTVTHVLGALRGWGDVLAQREPRPRLEGTKRTPEEMLILLEEITADIAASVKSHPQDAIVTGSRGGKTYAFVRGTVITHVMTHGMHHRAQALNMLRQLDAKPVPMSSVLEWSFTVDAPQ